MKLRFLAAALLVAAFPAVAADLRIGIPTETTSIDPHFQDLGPNAEISQQIYEALVRVGATEGIEPALAESWRITENPAIWEFRLRRNVRFHDGTPFTAADVVYSFIRVRDVPGAPSTVARNVRDIVEVTAVDDHTVRIRTNGPSPITPNNVAQVYIVSRARVDGLPTTAFNTGQAAIGTGPYRFVEYLPGSHVTLVANPNHWEGRPRWDRVTYRVLTNPGSRVAALLAGDVDIISGVPTADANRLSTDARVTVTRGVSNRVIFWAMDTHSETSPHFTARDGSPIANPFRDRRVREAVSLAIDRRAIAERVLNGMAQPASQIATPGIPGHDPNVPIPTVDLARARELMAAAGLPNGFRMALHATNNRYIGDSQQATAVAAMLARINIDVNVNAMPVALYFGRARRFEFGFLMVGWGHSTSDAYLVTRESIQSRSENNYGRWVNAQVDDLLARANVEMNTAERSAMLARAWRIAMDDFALIPTHFQVNAWAARRGLRAIPRTNEMTLAQGVVAE